MPYCVNCGSDIGAISIFRETICPDCDAYLHCCVQCKFFEPTAHNQCLEPQSDVVADREKANFCDFFKVAGETLPDEGGGPRPAGERDERAKAARAQLEALFKKPGSD